MLNANQIGSYRVDALIGVGGMGEVYRARDTRLQRDVAIKILPADVATDADRLARFTREAQVLAALNHPHIAQIYGIEESGSTRALVMEMVAGEDLSHRIARGPIPIDEALPIARQIAEALEAAHEQGIIHRDLKPANIKVSDEGTVKVLDFGLAKIADNAPSGVAHVSQSPTITTPAMTAAGMILGTAAYMSPEQAKGKDADRRSDVWAFGCVLYEMLTGRRPFDGDDVPETLAAILRGEVDFARLPSSTPTAVRRLIRRCLHKDRRWRLQHIGDARLDLEDVHHEPEATALVTSPMRSTWLAWGVAALAVTVAIGIGITALGERTVELTGAPVQFIIAPPPGTTFSTPSSGGTGVASQAAFSPDGRHIAFVALDEKGYRIWVRSLETPDPRPLQGTDGGAFPFWSPDSRNVGFFANGKLHRVDISGGPSLVVCDATSGRGGTWNAENVIVFAPGPSGPLKRVLATGGSPVDATHLDVDYGESAHRFPTFLPDGRHFLFTASVGACCPALKPARLRVGSLDSQDSSILLEAESNAVYAGGLLYYYRADSETLVAQRFDSATLSLHGEPQPVAEGISSEGSRYASFSVANSGSIVYGRGVGRLSQLTWFDRAGGVVSRIGNPAAIANLALSFDATQAAAAISAGGVTRAAASGRDLWVIDVGNQVRTRVTFDAGDDQAPVYSPDATQLAFGGNRNGTPVLLTKRVKGTGSEGILIDRERLARWGMTEAGSGPRSSVFPSDWSRDGRYIFFTASQGTNGSNDIWYLPLADGGKPIPIARSAANESDAMLSPDGKWLAYTSAESGVQEIYVQPFPRSGDGKRQVSDGGGVKPQWRADGKELFYFSTGTRELMAVPVTTTEDFTKGLATALFSIPVTFASGGPAASQQYVPTRDGTRFLVNMTLQEANLTPFTVMLNSSAALRPQR